MDLTQPHHNNIHCPSDYRWRLSTFEILPRATLTRIDFIHDSCDLKEGSRQRGMPLFLVLSRSGSNSFPFWDFISFFFGFSIESCVPCRVRAYFQE